MIRAVKSIMLLKADSQAIVIVGAGLLGSLAAWRLARQNPQLAGHIYVLEKSSRDQLQSAANTAAARVIHTPPLSRFECFFQLDGFQHLIPITSLHGSTYFIFLQGFFFSKLIPPCFSPPRRPFFGKP